jgi:hypothetical protein
VKQLLAVLGAVAMIAAAVLIRNALDDSGDGGSPTSGPGGTVTVACAEDLAAACDALEGAEGITVVREQAADTAALLAKDTPPAVDAWVTTAPWAELVDVQRTFAGLDPALGTGTLIARSPVVLAVDKGVRAQLADPQRCGTVGWACVGQQPSLARPSHASPDTATGLVELAAATSGWFEAGGKQTFSRDDFADPAFQTWLKGLEALVVRPNPPDLAPVQALFVAPGSYGAVGALEADVASRNLQRVDVLYPRPVVTADVVLVPVRGRKAAPGAASDRVRSGLRAAGWRVAGSAPPDIAPADVRTLGPNGLPRDAGVLIALRDTWAEVTR